jgi:hypothetical protein
MPTIKSSDLAPSGAVHYTLANAEFDLGGSGKKTFETEDADTIANALAHPWLVVEYPKADVPVGVYVDQVDPKDDPLSARFEGTVEESERSPSAGENTPIEPVAIDAGEDQGEVVKSGRVSETLAAADAAEPVETTTSVVETANAEATADADTTTSKKGS